MVLVDTSIWTKFLKNQPPISNTLDFLLDCNQIAGHDMVYGELLMGNNLNQRQELLSAFSLMHRSEIVPHGEVVQFVRDRKLQGRGISWVDVNLLASAVVDHFHLWTEDASLLAIAKELGISYEISSSLAERPS